MEFLEILEKLEMSGISGISEIMEILEIRKVRGENFGNFGSEFGRADRHPSDDRPLHYGSVARAWSVPRGGATIYIYII